MMMQFMFNVADDERQQDMGLVLDYNAVGLMSTNVSLYIHEKLCTGRSMYILS